MVAGHDGYVAPLQAGPQGVAVGAVLRTKRRADLGQWADLGHLGVGEQQVLRASLGEDGLAQSLRLLDALQAQVGAEVHDVCGAAGGTGHGDGPVDGLFLSPVRASLGEILRVSMAVSDEFVLQVLDDVAALAVELEHASGPGNHLHGLADVVIVAHPAGALLVGHEHLE